MENSSAPAEVPAGWERDAATGKLRPVKGEVREQRRRNFLRRKCRHARARALAACVVGRSQRLHLACLARSGSQTGDRRALRAPPGAVVLVRRRCSSARSGLYGQEGRRPIAAGSSRARPKLFQPHPRLPHPRHDDASRRRSTDSVGCPVPYRAAPTRPPARTHAQDGFKGFRKAKLKAARNRAVQVCVCVCVCVCMRDRAVQVCAASNAIYESVCMCMCVCM